MYPGQDKQHARDSVRVHRGFFCALGLPVVGDERYPETMFTSIVRQLSEAQPPITRLYVTGHSLGAALATMFSYALKAQWSGKSMKIAGMSENARSTPQRFRFFNAKNKKETTNDMHTTKAPAPPTAPATNPAQHRSSLLTKLTTQPTNEHSSIRVRAWQDDVARKLSGVYTYGSPRVGNDFFANDFDRLHADIPVHRFINQSDLVTHMPPPISASDDEYAADVIFDYAHVDGLRYIDGTQRALYCVNQDAPPTRWMALNVLDHLPGDYVRHINAALVAQVRDVQNAKMYQRLHTHTSTSTAANSAVVMTAVGANGSLGVQAQ